MNRVLLIWVLGAVLFSTCKSGDSPVDKGLESIPVPPGYTLVWNDEFDEPLINAGRWTHEVNARGGGNNELQYYTDRFNNSFIDNGTLIIRAYSEHYAGDEGSREYTSARLNTKNRGDWKYGRFEIRAKMPVGQGLWPAIWLLPTDNVYGGWAASGEIDIMEYLGHEPDKVYGTLHYGGRWPNNVHTGSSFALESQFNEAFHTFTLEWDSTSIAWFVDDSLYQTQTSWYSSECAFPCPFNQRFHLILNVAVGGNWPGNPDNTTVFPQEMVVDYVRVFQKVR